MLLLEEKLFIDIESNLINYTVKGDGAPLILIHGLGTSIDSWSLNIKGLSEKFKVYALDMPGFGDSITNKILSSEELADIVAKWCEKMDIKKAHFVGHSFGGEICLWLGIKYPRLVKSLVLAASTGLCSNVSHIEKLKNLLIDGVREPLYFLPKLLRAYHKAGPWRIIITVHKSYQKNLCKYLSKIKCPVFIVYGARDPVIIPEEDKKAVKKIKKAKVKIIDSTHGLIFDSPEEFNQEVINFIEALN